MSYVLGAFLKQPREELDYYVDFSDWLATGETVSTVSFEVSPVSSTNPLTVSAPFTSDNIVIGFTVRGGEDGTDYKVTMLTTTSNNQIVEREIYYTVEEQ